MFGKNQERLIYKAECTAPDLIVITGDLIDRNRTDLDAAMDLIRGIVKLAPVYYVSGNHEHQSGYYEDLVELLTAEGVKVLDNGKSILERDGDTITLLGLADKRVNPHYVYRRDASSRENFHGCQPWLRQQHIPLPHLQPSRIGCDHSVSQRGNRLYRNHNGMIYC